MSLDLDPRQRAMLAEMGVHVWAPAVAPDVVASPTVERLPAAATPATPATTATKTATAAALPSAHGTTRPAQTQRPLARTAAAAAPAMATPAPAIGIESFDATALRDAVAACQACAHGLGRTAAVLPGVWLGQQAHWMVVGDEPDDAQERAGEAFVGEAGRLLDNMLKAVGVRRYQPGAASDPAVSAHLALALKCRPALPTAPQRAALDTCASYLRREIALLRPKVILSMGRLAMQVLLSQDHPQGLTLPLGKLRGQVWRYQGVPVVVTYPPSYLLLHGSDKARAWEDLCLAADVAQQPIDGD
ncbi:MAG: uracil-DNA glycosylase [Rhodoferax sp.]|nr:uracil-DNA glycosylase [Rhodoferax sp.]